MLRLRLVCSLTFLALAGACRTMPATQTAEPAKRVVLEEAEPWRDLASRRDSALIEGLDGGWDRALSAGRAAGSSRRIAAEGPLLAPGGGLERGAPAPGPYRCRYVRPGGRRWAASPGGYCYVGVEAGQLSLATELRGLRLGGYLWELKGGERLVFLGASVPPGARTPPPYGVVPLRDAAGIFERIGDFRYRLVLPEPSPGAGFTVVEMIAAPRD
jgi:hypothetical protein